MGSLSPENEYRKYLALIRHNLLIFVVVAVAVCSVGVAVAYLLPPKYEARSTVFIEKSILGDLVKGLAVTQSIEGRLEVLTHMLSSRNLLQKVVAELDPELVEREGGASSLIRTFQANTKVTIKGDDLFTIQYADTDPRLARDFVNTLIAKYIEEHLATNRRESFGANRFMMEQMEHFRARIQEAEARLAAYSQSENYAVLGDEAVLVQEIAGVQRELDELDIRHHELQARRRLLNRGSRQGGTSDENLANLQRRRDQLMLQYTEAYPEVRLINAEIEQIRQNLKAAPAVSREAEGEVGTVEAAMVDIDLSAASARAAKLRSSLEEKKALLASLPEKRQTYNKLLRDRDAYQNTYEQLVQRYGRSELSKQMEIEDKVDTFRVVDPAVLPDKPANPNRAPIMLAGLVGGLAIGFGLLFARDYFDPSVKSIDSVQEIGLPVLALIPRFVTAEERQRQHRQTKAIATFASVYLLVFFLVLTYEVLQMLDVSLI